MKKIVFYIYFNLFFISCDKEPASKTSLEIYTDIYTRIISEFKPTCNILLPENHFFKGKIDGQDICVANGFDEYIIRNGQFTGGTVSVNDPINPSNATITGFWFSLNPPVNEFWVWKKDYTPGINIITPHVEDLSMKPHEILDSVLSIKRPLYLIEDIKNQKTDQHFRFDIHFTGTVSNEERFALLNAGEYQLPDRLQNKLSAIGTDYKFGLKEFKKETTATEYIYDVTFEIECDLKYDKSDGKLHTYGRLTEGIFKTQIILPRSE